jgi:predicted ATP-dependent protease
VPITRKTEDAWSQTTWEGNRRAQLRHALSLSLRERLQAVEDMAEVSERLREMRITQAAEKR